MRIALLCIGNEFRGDDGVGVEAGRQFEKRAAAGELQNEWQVFFGGETPENEFGAIREFAPQLVIVCDAVGGFKAGEVEFLDLQDERSYIFSTHNIPSPILLSYIRSFCQRVIFLGICVSIENVLEIRQNLSSKAQNAVKKAVEKLTQVDKISC